MAFALRLHPDSAMLPAAPDRVLIVDLVRQRMGSAWLADFFFSLCPAGGEGWLLAVYPGPAKARVGFLAFDLCPVMAMATEFRLPEVADFSAVRFLPGPGSTCLETFGSGCFPIDFAIALAGSAVVAAAGF